MHVLEIFKARKQEHDQTFIHTYILTYTHHIKGWIHAKASNKVPTLVGHNPAGCPTAMGLERHQVCENGKCSAISYSVRWTPSNLKYIKSLRSLKTNSMSQQQPSTDRQPRRHKIVHQHNGNIQLHQGCKIHSMQVRAMKYT